MDGSIDELTSQSTAMRGRSRRRVVRWSSSSSSPKRRFSRRLARRSAVSPRGLLTGGGPGAVPSARASGGTARRSPGGAGRRPARPARAGGCRWPGRPGRAGPGVRPRPASSAVWARSCRPPLTVSRRRGLLLGARQAGGPAVIGGPETSRTRRRTARGPRRCWSGSTRARTGNRGADPAGRTSAPVGPARTRRVGRRTPTSRSSLAKTTRS